MRAAVFRQFTLCLRSLALSVRDIFIGSGNSEYERLKSPLRELSCSRHIARFMRSTFHGKVPSAKQAHVCVVIVFEPRYFFVVLCGLAATSDYSWLCAGRGTTVC